MNDMPYDCGSIRRADLELRHRYYGMKTKIFLIEEHKYAIQILDYMEFYKEIKKEFDETIRSATDWVELVLNEPKKYKMEIEPLANPAMNSEGIFLNRKMLDSLLISRFPKIKFVDIKVENQNEVNLIISVGNETKDIEIECISRFLYGMKNGYKKVFVEKVDTDNPGMIIKDVELACTDRNFKFSVEDSEFWFENVEKIYDGKIGKESLRFFDNKKTKCFMDFSIFGNENINIRSSALLYDTIYLSFPLGDGLTNFLAQQHLKMTDLEEMVSRGKLVILLPNTEERYDRKTIERLYATEPRSIVSKRGMNALMAMFFCELEQKYMDFWAGHEDILKYLCESYLKNNDASAKIVLDFLMWPIWAKNRSYNVLNSFGPIRIPAIGVNNLFDNIKKDPKHADAIDFEIAANANAIHIASALQATYFPFSEKQGTRTYTDLPVANMLGSIINLYRYMGHEQQKDVGEYSKIFSKEQLAISLLRPDNSIDMKHILDYGLELKTTVTLKRILENLSELDERKRIETINEYNNQIAEIGKEKFTKENALGYILSGASFIPGIGIVCSVIDILYKILKDSGLKTELVKQRITFGTSSSSDKVYILDKLSRVAKISHE